MFKGYISSVLGLKNSYVWELVFLRLGLVNLTFGVLFSYV